MPLLKRKKVRFQPLAAPLEAYQHSHPPLPFHPQQGSAPEDEDTLIMLPKPSEPEQIEDENSAEGERPEEKIDGNREVFYMKETGEIFLDYNSYASRVMFYNQKQFQCEATGKAPISYFAALKSEKEESRHTHEKFPKRLKGPVLRSVQFQIQGRLDHLTDAVHDRFSNRFFEGERVIVDINRAKYHAVIHSTHVAPPNLSIPVPPQPGLTDENLLASASPFSMPPTPEQMAPPMPEFQQAHVPEADPPTILLDPQDKLDHPHARGLDLTLSNEEAEQIDPPAGYAYAVRLVDNYGRGPKNRGVVLVLASDLSRDRLTFSKTILKKYLKDSLDRDPSLASPWTVKPSLCVKYGIPLTPDDELQADLTKKKTGAINKRKRNKDDEFPENGEGEDADGKKKKRRRRNSQGVLVDVPDSPTKGGDENSPTNVRRKPIKYPAEDFLCDLTMKESASGKAIQRPLFHRELLFGSNDRFEMVIMTWCCLNAFGKTLALSPFTLDDFFSSLTYDVLDPPHPLTAEIHASLLNVLMKDPQPRPLRTYGSPSCIPYEAILKGKKAKGKAKMEPAPLDVISVEGEDGDTTMTMDEDKDEEDEDEEDEEDITEGYPGLTKRVMVVESSKIVERSGWREGKELKHKDGRKRWEACLVACLLERADLESIPSLPRILAHLLFSPPESPELSEDDENPSWAVATPPRSGLRTSLPSQRYPTLPSELKLDALAFLCELAVQTKVAREAMEESSAALTEVRKDLMDIKRERKKLAEERLALGGAGLKSSTTEEHGLDSRMSSHVDDDAMSTASDPFLVSTTHNISNFHVEEDMSVLSDIGSDDGTERASVRASLGADLDQDDLMDDHVSDSASLAGGSNSGRPLKTSSVRQATLKNQQLAKQAENAAKAEHLAKEKEQSRLAKHSSDLKRIEEDDLKLLKQEEALNRDFRKHINFPRVRPLGQDRFGNKVWWFDGIGSAPLVGQGGIVVVGTGRLFLQGGTAADRTWWGEKAEFSDEEIQLKREKEEGEEGMLEEGEWAVLEDPEEMTAFLNWLNPRGHRESKLINTLKHLWEYLHSGAEKRYQELQSRHDVQANDSRRATRQTALPDFRHDASLQWRNKKAVDHIPR